MDIEFQTYVPMHRKPGEEIQIGPVKWVCCRACILVGYVLETGEPVIGGECGPEMNSCHFVKSGTFRKSPKPGQTITEMEALNRCWQIKPTELVGKTIGYVRYGCDSILIFCTDNSYCKLEATRDQYDDEDVSLTEEDITFSDMRAMGAISDEEYAAHDDECEVIKAFAQRAADIRQFKAAAKQVGLGKQKVEELLNATN